MAVKKRKGYISGGMTDIPAFNFPLFDEVAAAWEAEGNVAFSPAENDRVELRKRGIDDVTTVPGYETGDVSRYNESIGDTKDLFRWDFNTITNKCDCIVMIPGWESSTGARWERTVAEALGLTVFLAMSQDPTGNWAFVEDPQQQRVSTHLRTFGADVPNPLDALGVEYTPRELLDKLTAKLSHVPGMRSSLERIGAQLA